MEDVLFSCFLYFFGGQRQTFSVFSCFLSTSHVHTEAVSSVGSSADGSCEFESLLGCYWVSKGLFGNLTRGQRTLLALVPPGP